MKQIRQMTLFLMHIVLCGGYDFWKNGLYFSSEGTTHAEKRGLRYGPSGEILLTCEKENGNQGLVGRWEKWLSAVCAEPKGNMFWKTAELKKGYGHYLSIEEMVEVYPIDENRIVSFPHCPRWRKALVIGMFDRDSFMKIHFAGGCHGGDREWLLFAEVDIPENKNRGDCDIGYLEGRTAAGEMVEKRKKWQLIPAERVI